MSDVVGDIKTGRIKVESNSSRPEVLEECYDDGEVYNILSSKSYRRHWWWLISFCLYQLIFVLVSFFAGEFSLGLNLLLIWIFDPITWPTSQLSLLCAGFLQLLYLVFKITPKLLCLILTHKFAARRGFSRSVGPPAVSPSNPPVTNTVRKLVEGYYSNYYYFFFKIFIRLRALPTLFPAIIYVIIFKWFSPNPRRWLLVLFCFFFVFVISVVFLCSEPYFFPNSILIIYWLVVGVARYYYGIIFSAGRSITRNYVIMHYGWQ